MVTKLLTLLVNLVIEHCWVIKMYGWNLLQEEIFVNHAILLSEKVFDYFLSTTGDTYRRYMGPIITWLIFVNVFKIVK